MLCGQLESVLMSAHLHQRERGRIAMYLYRSDEAESQAPRGDELAELAVILPEVDLQHGR